jgi:hypothetical protein
MVENIDLHIRVHPETREKFYEMYGRVRSKGKCTTQDTFLSMALDLVARSFPPRKDGTSDPTAPYR